jgi:hypothetical protein
VFPDETQELRIEVDLVAEMSVLNPFDFFLAPYAEKAIRSNTNRPSGASSRRISARRRRRR